jgi:hypothetical protein
MLFLVTNLDEGTLFWFDFYAMADQFKSCF